MNALAHIATMTSIPPEKRFAAGLIADALAEARAGDISARLWLHHVALSWLSFIVPDTVDAGDVHQALLATLPTVGADGIGRLAMQLDLDGLEAA